MNSFWPVLVVGIIAYRGFKGNYNSAVPWKAHASNTARADSRYPACAGRNRELRQLLI